MNPNEEERKAQESELERAIRKRWAAVFGDVRHSRIENAKKKARAKTKRKAARAARKANR